MAGEAREGRGVCQIVHIYYLLYLVKWFTKGIGRSKKSKICPHGSWTTPNRPPHTGARSQKKSPQHFVAMNFLNFLLSKVGT